MACLPRALFKQRWLHYYCLNELLCLTFFCWLCMGIEFGIVRTLVGLFTGFGAFDRKFDTGAQRFTSDTLILDHLSSFTVPLWLVSGLTLLPTGSAPPLPSPLVVMIPRLVRVSLVLLASYLGAMFLMLVILCLRRIFRHSKHALVWSPRFPDYIRPHFRELTITSRDGVRLRVLVSEGGRAKDGAGSPTVTTTARTKKRRRQKSGKQQQASSPSSPRKVMLLAAPLGQCGPSIYTPIMAHFGPEYIYVTWDYRGFFSSDTHPSSTAHRLRPLSIPEHARDAADVLAACGFSHADVVVGHSMGVAVALELVLLFPRKVKSMVLMNGFHGHVFSTAFQPLVRVPFAGDVITSILEWGMAHPDILGMGRVLLMCWLRVFLPIYTKLFGSELLMAELGHDYFLRFMDDYLGRLAASRTNLHHWLLHFQELDAHSVYHLLPTIDQPVLIISGFLDMLTPAMQSVEMARRMPQAVHYCDPFSSHATIIESPEWSIAEIDSFLSNLSPT